MRRWEYGDPAMVVERRQDASCHGCKWKEEIFGREFCNHPQHSTVELRKCRHYTLRGQDE